MDYRLAITLTTILCCIAGLITTVVLANPSSGTPRSFPHLKDSAADTIAADSFSQIVKFDHGFHEKLEMDCSDCHSQKAKKKSSTPVMPGIETCSICHSEVLLTIPARPYNHQQIYGDSASSRTWFQYHARVASESFEKCELCHNIDKSCGDCHRKLKIQPNNHKSINWLE
jgi:hypothetical protein